MTGLQTASVVVPNPVLRHKVNRGLNTDEVAEPNAFAVEAAIAAYTQGEEWLDELRAYIKNNINTSIEFIRLYIPEIQVVKSEATYLLWLDCHKVAYNNTSVLCGVIRKETGLYLSEGSAYGENGKSFLRMNLGTQHSRVLDGLERLKVGVKRYNEIAAEHPCGIVAPGSY